MAFWKEMRDAKANWEFVTYGNARHTLHQLADARTAAASHLQQASGSALTGRHAGFL
jgi:hypothetical protein